MRTACYLYKGSQTEKSLIQTDLNRDVCQLVLAFGSASLLSQEPTFTNLRKSFPHSNIVLCSTAGEIFGKEVYDDSVVITAIELERTELQFAQTNIKDHQNSEEAGLALMEQLNKDNLRYVMVLSDGETVNGSKLVTAMNSLSDKSVIVTGGLAGNGISFQSTVVGLNAAASRGNLVAIGFYGDAIHINHGSMGGWENFGMEKTVTRSHTNILYEIDGKNALELYQKYLGIYAEDLPGSALLFPLSVKSSTHQDPVVRTILGIDHKNKSMIFAGDVPQGSKVRFMKSNMDQLIDAATGAAQKSLNEHSTHLPKLVLIISCVGRKLVLGKRVDEEIEAVADIFGPSVPLTGFYSYGEISPILPKGPCELHNQTITITTFDEY